MKKIIRNRIKCNLCGDIIESKNRHDFVECKCGSCLVTRRIRLFKMMLYKFDR